MKMTMIKKERSLLFLLGHVHERTFTFPAFVQAMAAGVAADVTAVSSPGEFRP
jgi:hypothetical protein